MRLRRRYQFRLARAAATTTATTTKTSATSSATNDADIDNAKNKDHNAETNDNADITSNDEAEAVSWEITNKLQKERKLPTLNQNTRHRSRPASASYPKIE